MAYGTAISNKTGVKDLESEGENSSLFFFDDCYELAQSACEAQCHQHEEDEDTCEKAFHLHNGIAGFKFKFPYENAITSYVLTHLQIQA